MFSRELTEIQQRQLALKLRNIELRGQLQTELAALARPVSCWGAVGGVAGLLLLLANLRRPGRVSRLLGLAQLSLRVLRLLRQFSRS